MDLLSAVFPIQVLSKAPIVLGLWFAWRARRFQGIRWYQGLPYLAVGGSLAGLLTLMGNWLIYGAGGSVDVVLWELGIRAATLNVVAILSWLYLIGGPRSLGIGTDLVVGIGLGGIVAGGAGLIHWQLLPGFSSELAASVIFFAIVVPAYRSLMWQIRRLVTALLVTGVFVVCCVGVFLALQSGLVVF